MPLNVLQLAEAIADLIDFPKPTAQLIVRIGREAGLLSTGGRGRNAAKAISTDAANLLIAMMVCPSPARAAEYMRDFGDLILFPELGQRGTILRPHATNLFVPGQTFRDGIAAIIDALGSHDFCHDDEMLSHIFSRLSERVVDGPKVEVMICDTDFRAQISFYDNVFRYAPAALYAHSDIEGLGGLSGEQLANAQAIVARQITQRAGKIHLPLSLIAEQVGKYSRAIRSERTARSDLILDIAKLVNGRDFFDIVRGDPVSV